MSFTRVIININFKGIFTQINKDIFKIVPISMLLKKPVKEPQITKTY